MLLVYYSLVKRIKPVFRLTYGIAFSHLTQTSSWLPPVETWAETGGGLPYGWEEATDDDGKPYFIK
jgi:WW domain.